MAEKNKLSVTVRGIFEKGANLNPNKYKITLYNTENEQTIVSITLDVNNTKLLHSLLQNMLFSNQPEAKQN